MSWWAVSAAAAHEAGRGAGSAGASATATPAAAPRTVAVRKSGTDLAIMIAGTVKGSKPQPQPTHANPAGRSISAVLWANHAVFRAVAGCNLGGTAIALPSVYCIFQKPGSADRSSPPRT